MYMYVVICRSQDTYKRQNTKCPSISTVEHATHTEYSVGLLLPCLVLAVRCCCLCCIRFSSSVVPFSFGNLNPFHHFFVFFLFCLFYSYFLSLLFSAHPFVSSSSLYATRLPAHLQRHLLSPHDWLGLCHCSPTQRPLLLCCLACERAAVVTRLSAVDPPRA